VRRRLKKSIFNLICVCGNPFTADHNRALYCSDDCRKLAALTSWRKYRENNISACRERVRLQYEKDPQKIIAKTKAYHNTLRGKEACRKSDIKMRKKFPERVQAREVVNRVNFIKKQCETCGTPNAHKHHDDYSKPLKIRWLCASCHMAYHKLLRRADHENCAVNG